MVQTLYVPIFTFLLGYYPQGDTESNSEVARKPLLRKYEMKKNIKSQTLKSGKHEADFTQHQTLQLHCEMKMMIQEAQQKCTQSANDAY